MRRPFVQLLVSLAEKDRRLVLLSADVGYTVLETFAERHPDRFFNVGVAEQNMVGIATGMAEAGFIPFVYSMATFLTMRAFEFIRNGPVLHGLPVRMIGVGGGFEYGSAGVTHYGLEDVGILRTLPGIRIVTPGDHAQAVSSLETTWNLEGPTYYRLSKDDTTVVPGLDGRFMLGDAQVVRPGCDVIFIGMGPSVLEGLKAAEMLTQEHVQAAVMLLSCISPPPKERIIETLSQFNLGVVIEAHSVVGGAGSLVSEIVAEESIPCRIVRCGAGKIPPGLTGGKRFMEKLNGISADVLKDVVLSELGRKKGKKVSSETKT
ncbi:MAG: 1-deoxy-D-xylulose-5-phosphate synthase [Deltaproteobacteria bacterium]|nr:1-deoxy-D-xylulose-5-phosphate synthase [Deltaproteobacteria bacterium]